MVEIVVDGLGATYASSDGSPATTFAYAVVTDGLPAGWCHLRTTVYEGPLGAAAFPVWSRTTTDFLGRTILEERPGFGDDILLVNTLTYEPGTGRLASTAAFSVNAVNPVNPVTLSQTIFVYDSLGERYRTVQDLDLDGIVDLAGPDRVTDSHAGYWFGDAGLPSRSLGEGWHRESRQYIYPDENATPKLVSTQRQRLTGLGSAVDGGILVAESVSIDLLEKPTVSRTVLDRAARRVVQTSDSPASTLDALSVSVNGLTLTNVTSTGVTTTFGYDSLGRRISSRTGDRLVALASYHSYHGRLASTSEIYVAPGSSEPTTNRTTFAYDPLTGHRISVTDPINQATHTAYDTEGRVVATWGSTYPVAYEYDAFGRMAAMATTRDPAHESVNLLTLLPAGVHLSHTSHASYPCHLLDTTRWLYHEPTGLLTNKVYADGKGTSYSYTPDGKLASRTWARISPVTGLPLQTLYSYDATHTLAGIAYSDATPAVTFAYDRLGRQLSAITAGVSTNLFAYDALTLALANETVIAFGETNVLTRAQDTLGRPAGIRLGDPSDPSYASDYGYDEFGRFHSVSSLVSSVLSVATYTYLSGSHLISGYTQGDLARAVTYEPHRDLIAAVSNTFGGTLVSAFDYTNDALGRRTARIDAQPALDPVQNVFGYNVRSEVQSALMGTNTYGYVFDPIGNRIAATNNAVATAYLANELNQYTNVVLDGEAPSEPRHDDDGNMLYLPSTSGGGAGGEGWYLQWDGENRLLAASNATTLVTYVHDFQSRRIGRKQYTWDTDHWSPVTDQRFLYDGWALIRERTHTQTHTLTNSYTYGLDLSGSFQGAGTIGGILSANLNGTTVFYAYDGNGNVTDLVDTNGAIRAHYGYDAFGNVTAQSGDLAAANPFRFSTKRQDEATSLLYYGYRDLDTVWGRWVSRDPIGERGGLNRYAACRNASVRRVDSLGLASVIWNPDPNLDPGDPRKLLPPKEPMLPAPPEIFYPAPVDWEDGLIDYPEEWFNGLKRKLANELQSMCPEKPTVWSVKGEVKCCDPMDCKHEARIFSYAYITEMERAHKARKALFGGDPGNVELKVRELLDRSLGDQMCFYYPDKLSPGFICYGWADLARAMFDKTVGGESNCWSFRKILRTRSIDALKLVYEHEWAALQIMGGSELELDPWPSGGKDY